jgi:hypothetical protein
MKQPIGILLTINRNAPQLRHRKRHTRRGRPETRAAVLASTAEAWYVRTCSPESVSVPMPLVVSGFILVGALCLLNLLLTLGVLRRLREHSARLAEVPDFSMEDGPAYSAKFTGRPLPDFSARAIDGTQISPQSLMGSPGMIAVLRVGCGPCHEQLPGFVGWAGDTDATATALVTGPSSDATDMIGRLADVSVVVAGREADALAETLGVNVFPTFLEMDSSGVVVRAETHLSRMDIPDPAQTVRH